MKIEAIADKGEGINRIIVSDSAGVWLVDTGERENQFENHASTLKALYYAIERIAELESERAALAFQLENREGLVQRSIEKEEQYDALAAHAECLTQRWRAFVASGDDRDGAANAMQEAVEQGPETSLVRLIADTWSEASDEVMALSAPKSAKTFQLSASRHLKYKAEKLRRPAEVTASQATAQGEKSA